MEAVKKLMPAVCAAALAIELLLHPGGPYNNIPLGGFNTLIRKVQKRKRKSEN
jgi:hypothetical protein